MTTLKSADKYQELLGTDVEATPYNYAMLFKADGFLARRRAQKRFVLLKSIDSRLRPILDSNEKVYFVTRGTATSLGEQFLVGWLAYFLNIYALVFTSNRIVLLRIDGSRRPRELVSQMSYAAIVSVKSTWNSLCRVKLLDKNTYDFQHVPAADRKFLAKFLVGVVRGSSAPFQRGVGVEHLCPHCFAVVPGHPPTCPVCFGRFKSGLQAGLRSFLFPGLGHWYLGNRGFAVAEMFITVVLWLGLVILPLIAPSALPYPHLGRGYWFVATGALFVVHSIDGLMARHFARKGHYPAAKPVAAAPRSTSSSPAVAMPKPAATGTKKALSLRRDQPNDKVE